MGVPKLLVVGVPNELVVVVVPNAFVVVPPNAFEGVPNALGATPNGVAAAVDDGVSKELPPNKLAGSELAAAPNSELGFCPNGNV